MLDELGALHIKAAVALVLEDAEAGAQALEQLGHRGQQCDVVRPRERTECTLITTLALLSQAELAEAADQASVAQERLREAARIWPQPDDALLVTKRMHKLRERLR